MTTKISATVAFFLLILSAASFQFSSSARACEDEAHASSRDPSSNQPSLVLTENGSQKAVFEVKGIMCKSCEKEIKSALSKVQGVKNVAFLKAGSKEGTRIAQVTFNEGSKVSAQDLTKAIEGAGFKASIKQ